MTSAVLKAHLERELLERYSLHQLPQDDCDRVDDHLLICERCCNELLEVEAEVRMMKAVCREMEAVRLEQAKTVAMPKRGFRLWAWNSPVWAGALAALLIVVAVPYFVNGGNGAAPTAVDLAAMRGAESSVIRTVEGGHGLVLRMDAREFPDTAQLRGEIVGQAGRTVWSGNARLKDGKAVLDARTQLGPGLYWIRMYSGADSHPSREYGLRVK